MKFKAYWRFPESTIAGKNTPQVHCVSNVVERNVYSGLIQAVTLNMYWTMHTTLPCPPVAAEWRETRRPFLYHPPRSSRCHFLCIFQFQPVQTLTLTLARDSERKRRKKTRMRCGGVVTSMGVILQGFKIDRQLLVVGASSSRKFCLSFFYWFCNYGSKKRVLLSLYNALRCANRWNV